MKTNKITDMDLVFQEWHNLYINCSHYSCINDVRYPIKNGLCLGTKIPHIKESNYNEIYESVSNKNAFSIMFIDGGLATFYYEFDDKKRIHSHSLHYLPNILIESEEDDFYNLFSNYSKDNILSKYLRVDFGEEGYKEFYHSICHVHFSLIKDALRIPCETWFSPMEFLMFIMTNIYHCPIDIEYRFKNKTLTDNELMKFYLRIGNEKRDLK